MKMPMPTNPVVPPLAQPLPSLPIVLRQMLLVPAQLSLQQPSLPLVRTQSQQQPQQQHE
eukprot:CAMPEP_0206423000 /NCGR_PEP_ID=MMETSP0324_2-20121206/2428_2 /ASSEMBLY_ACC=CAM_ASM_000836 /TAXON_ID=2866 /ORGANISM="Crypthecodinium cohnii, Strain Seligo" /LENGTH=58 /DNA_ID=CAMNT_0053887493 /DNA_START=493 /DNA_END=666 /DNA_ORIENTATION=-